MITFWLYMTISGLASNATLIPVSSVVQMPNWATCLKVEEHLHKLHPGADTECRAEKTS